MLKKKLSELYELMKSSEERVLVHCAAGIHRTGIVAYTLLRIDSQNHHNSDQNSPKETYCLETHEKMKLMRVDTYKGVG